jgi:hypothetical protein
MIDFSDREEVKRWLDAIEPAERRREVAVALAARAALRVVPLLIAEFDLHTDVRDVVLSEIILPIFRGMLVTWAAAKYPARREEFRAAATAAAANFAPIDIATGAAGAAAFTLESAIAAVRLIAVPIVDAIPTAVHAIDAAIHAAADAAGRAGEGTPGAGSASCDDDAEAIESGLSATEIAGNSLWPEGAPSWAVGAWQELKSVLLSSADDWEVWSDWYEGRLAGDERNPPIEALEVARATIPDKIWEFGPYDVNAEIRRLIAEHQGLQQRPAAFQFRVVDDKIDALPEDARPIDAETARDFYDEAKRKGQDLRERLQRAQADENIRAHVDLLLARLGSSYADLRPGLMISVLRSLESDVRAYDSEEGRKELSAAHLSSIFTLADSVRDLCAIFPRSREIEAEAVSLDLPMRRLPEIRETIDSVVAKVNRSDGATEGGREAINASAADLAHQRGLAEEAKQSAYFLVDFANFTRAGVKYLKATGRAVGGEIAGLGADSWRALRRGAPKGVERGAAQAGKALVVGGVAVLMHWLGSDIAALGAMVGPYLPLHEILEKMTGAAPDAPAPDADAGSTSPEDADDAPAPRPSTPRKPKARKRGK